MCAEVHSDAPGGIEWDGEVYWTYCKKCDFWTEHEAKDVEREIEDETLRTKET
jgi:hypothetical protein